MSIKIIIPGALSTVQDAGRYGYQAMGFSPSGAADQRALRQANRLVGNDTGEAVIEMTLLGMTVQFSRRCLIAITGADMTPYQNGKPVEAYQTLEVEAGDYLSMGAAKNGCRAYLAVSGGFDLPRVMGSLSTNLKCGIGGFCGRKLKSGDIIPLKDRREELPETRLKLERPQYPDEIILRFVWGPQDDMFDDEAKRSFISSPYRVQPASDRMGLRLEGQALKAVGGVDIISDGIALGSVQIPANGQPIVLLADHQTTGGYVKIGTVISSDIPAAAQAIPGNILRFEPVTVEQAQKIAAEDEEL